MVSKNLFEREVSRCNRNFFIFNICLTILASWIISWFFFDFEILGKIIVVIVLLAFPGYNYYKLYNRLKDYQNHPLYKRLLRFDEPSKIAEMIEEDLKKNILIEKGSNIITPNWIVIRSFFNFQIIHSTEVFWVYVLRTKHSINFIPTGSTYSINIYSRHGDVIEIPCGSQEESEQLIETIYSVYPWAIYGFSEEIKSLWEDNPGKLIQEVNQRILDIQKLIKEHGKRKKK